MGLNPSIAIEAPESEAGIILFNRTCGQASDKIIHEKGVDDQNRDAPREASRHEGAPEIDIPTHEFGKYPDRYGLFKFVLDKDQGVEKLIPAQGEREQDRTRHPRQGHRQNNLQQSSQPAAPVDIGALLDLKWHGSEVAHQ